MTRPITLFTGQWADLPFEEVCRLAASWGYDGLEIACWGDHFEVDRALDGGRLRRRPPARSSSVTASRSGRSPTTWSGQAVCDDPIDHRHQDILPAPSGATATPRACGSAPPSGWRTPPGPPRARRRHRHRLHRLGDLEVRRDVPAGLRGDDRGRLRRTSPTGGTRSWTSSTRSACGSPTRCTPARSPMTTGPRCGRWRRSATGPRSA